MYEAKALFEIGTYRTDVNSAPVDLEPKENLVKRLFTKYVILETTKIGDYDPQITSVEIPKKTTSLVEIVAVAKSNKLAVEKLKKVISDIKVTHNQIVATLKSRFKSRIEQIDLQLANLKNKEENFSIDIESNKQLINNLTRSIINEKIPSDNNRDLIKQNRDMIIYANIAETARKSSDLEHQSMKLEFQSKELYLKEKNDLMLLLTDFNLKPSKLVGDFQTFDFPSSPKIVILYIVSLVLSFVFAIIWGVYTYSNK